MKLLTLNTHSWIEESPLEKLEAIMEQLLADSYDVISLQEVNQSMDAEEAEVDSFFIAPNQDTVIKKDNFAFLLQQELKKEGLEYYWSWVPSHIGYDQYDEGIAILTRFKVTNARGILLSRKDDYTDYHTRKALEVSFQASERNYLVYGLHLSWWQDETESYPFLYEWNKLVEAWEAEARAGGCILLMGDFNNPAHIEEEGYSVVSKHPYLKDAYLDATVKNGSHTVEKKIDGWENNSDLLRIDYIFVSSNLSVYSYETVFDGNTTPVVSDHFGVKVEIG
ncbi:endonuclease/exonuclease/phosphatase family protein [Niallia circulans]|uniref:endonuclease/exonuclease/phosphatase family protein n=1 Tax=Niallia circulans TaxID=1397 RepID=UPI0015609D4C|nr:endonuclease/exonuclease/phosphatase family protein [Niallia circulans]NRG32515.1 endonuclease/exonuclease/phosphatase family protein [Niallia circulans]